MEVILTKRLEELIHNWNASLSFNLSKIEHHKDDPNFENIQVYLRKEPIRHEIMVKNQRLQVSPPIATTRMLLNKDLQHWLGFICELPRCSSFLRGGETDFRAVLSKIDPKTMTKAYESIEALMSKLQVCLMFLFEVMYFFKVKNK